MISSPDFHNTTSRLGASEKNSFGRFLGQLLLIGVLALSACSQVNQEHLKPGTADYSHYPSGGGLFVSAAFGPDGRLWRVVPEKQQVYTANGHALRFLESPPLPQGEGDKSRNPCPYRVYVDYSTDLGKTFSAPVLINAQAQRIKVSGENRPGIAVDSAGRIYVIYAAEGTQPVAVYLSMSADNGRSFSSPSPISDKAAEANSFQGRLALSPSGQAYVFWHDERNRTDWKQPGNAIYYTTINGQGGLNVAAQKLSDTLCDCCRIAAAFDSDAQLVLLARFIYPGGIRDHGLIRTQANGKKPLEWRVTFDQWAIEACPDHGPSLAISDANYHIAWFTQGSVRQGLFYAYSSDRGEHFSTPLAFGNADKLPSHPDIMAKGKQVVLTWTEFDGNKTQLMVLQSNDGGQTWLPAKAVAASAAEADFPFLLSRNDSIFVSWNSKNEGYRLIPLN